MAQELTTGTGLIARYGLDEGTGTAVGNSVVGPPAGGITGTTAPAAGPLWVSGFPLPVQQ